MALFKKQVVDDKPYVTLAEITKDSSSEERKTEQMNIFNRLDVDKNKRLSGEEFWQANLKVRFPDIPTELFLMETFAARDANNDGSLTENEIEQAWVMGPKEYALGFDVKELLAKSDHNGDGKVDIQEFIKTWKTMLRAKKFPVKA